MQLDGVVPKCPGKKVDTAPGHFATRRGLEANRFGSGRYILCGRQNFSSFRNLWLMNTRNLTAFSLILFFSTTQQACAENGIFGNRGGFLLEEDFEQAEADSLREELNRVYNQAVRDAVEQGNFRAAFLRQVPFLVRKSEGGGGGKPGSARILGDRSVVTYRQYDKIEIKCDSPGCFAVGDSVDIIRRLRTVSFMDISSRIYQRVGLARISRVQGKKVDAEVLSASNMILPEDLVALHEMFTDIEVSEYFDPTTSLSGSVLDRVEETRSPYLYQSVLINLGRSEGVQRGDLFAVYPKTESEGYRMTPSTVGAAVEIGDGWSTLTITKMFDNTLDQGDRVELVRRAAER